LRIGQQVLGPLVVMIAFLPVIGQEKPSRELNASPRVFLLNGNELEAIRAEVFSKDPKVNAAVARLELDARKLLSAGPFSVVFKEATPPSGDKHDYMSQAPYFWPDPKMPGGLHYIRRDGERNPEINKLTDHRSLDQMEDAVETFALAYYYRPDEAYASKAAQLLRAWFLDPATKMNPNLQFAQAIPGVNTGRGIGLIETRGLTRVVDAIGLLHGSKAWTEDDQRGVEAWFSKFLNWMLASKHGRDEAAAKNNHGTYYDLQAASFALFVGKRQLARRILSAAQRKRIETQIEPDGHQPLELVRTKAWSYSVGNLDGLMQLATLGDKLGLDLWNYRSADGRSLRKALEYLAPFAFGERKWEYQQLGEWPPQMLFPLLRRAAHQYKDRQFDALISRVPDVDTADRSRLLSLRIEGDVSSSK
jgi:hypothetical protein